MYIVGGTLKNRPIAAPKGLSTRPTSSRLRETLFNICQGYIEGARFLDLFAGSGAMGLEAVSRGASSCAFVDQDRESVRCIQENIKKMQIETKSKVFMGNVFAWLDKRSTGTSTYTIIYADPPYDATINVGSAIRSFSQHLLFIIDQTSVLEEGGILFIEDSTAFKPDMESLLNLEIVSERRCGPATLWQFRRLTNFSARE